MGETLYNQIVAIGQPGGRCRIYAPVGSYATLLPYLVRRLLENGANSSFVNRIVDENVGIDELIADPLTQVQHEGGMPHLGIPLPRDLFGNERRNSAGLDLSSDNVIAALDADLRQLQHRHWHAAPLLADGDAPADRNVSLPVSNPADRNDLVGSVTEASPADVDRAIAAAAAFAADWHAVPPSRRAALLRACADAFEARRSELIALCIREAGKTWPNAVAEIREAVDFCRYYAAQARALFGANRRATTAQPLVGFLGAANDVVEQGKRITEDGQADLQGVDPAAGTITNWLAARPAQFAGLDAGDALDQVLGVQDAAGTLERMGAFFALSQSEYGTILATGGASQPTIAAATVPHTVTTYDTANALEQRFGVDFASILQINGMLPDEALFPGTVLQVPVVQFSGPRFIAGLPTFGSQVGIAAWGSDATLDLQVDDGDLVVIAGQDVIVQGVTFLEEQIGADLLDLAQVTDASASPTIIGAKVRQTLLSDLRIAAVPRVDVASKPGAAGIAIAVQAQPINVRSAVYVGG